MSEIAIDGRVIEMTNRDRIYFPDDGITKGDLLDYYQAIGAVMVPHLADRPLSMERFPNGISGEGFYQKEIGRHFPDWIHRAEMTKRGGTVTHVLVDDVATLLYVTNQGCIAPHVWTRRATTPMNPDRVVFDLDPDDDGFEPVRFAARSLLVLLGELELPAFVLVTGSRGAHIVVPSDRTLDGERAYELARAIAAELVARHPDRLTDAWRKKKRGGRLLLDVRRNGYAQTVIAPYAVRARPGAAVAMPIRLEELDDPKLRANGFDMARARTRVEADGDAWESIDRAAVDLTPSAERLGLRWPGEPP